MGMVAVTGGAGGIGKATVLAVQRAGRLVASLDLTPNPQADLSLIADITDEAALAAAFGRLGDLDGLVCIAGVNAHGRVEDLSWQDWKRVMSVNVNGAMLAMKHASPKMRAGGSVVLMGSAHTGAGGSVAYHASKGAVLGLMRASSGEFAPRGIRVNAVSPGRVDTAFANRALATKPDGAANPAKAGAAYMLGRMARAEEVAEAILFLLSDESSFVCGAELIVDGRFLRQK